MMMGTYRRHRYQFNAIIVSLISTFLLVGILNIITGWPFYLLWILSVSVVTFGLFGVDKALSKTDRARVPESVLHFFTLIGGFPGQILGRIVFRHKTSFKRHPSFTIVLVISIVIQIAVIILIF
ncbi:MAG: DUF1294 domain-containing protein [Candidatus Promineifilaceae bacterium]